MPTSDKELDKKRQRVEKLREQLASEEAGRVEHAREISNDVVGAQLDAEAARLEGQLAEAKRLGRVTEAKSGASALIEAAKEDQGIAEAFAAANAKANEKKEG